MNLTDITVTSLHKAYEAVYERANARGIRVTGSEMVGVVPLQAMLDAGKYFLRKQERSTGIPEREIIKIAIKSMGLDELYPFDPDKKIIEYILKDDKKQLIDMNLTEFADETASESPAPGGGSISAYVGSLGAALGTMVANLSAHKRGWDERWEEFSDWPKKAWLLKKSCWLWWMKIPMLSTKLWMLLACLKVLTKKNQLVKKPLMMQPSTLSRCLSV